jgi:hypothetical protein
MADSKHSDSAKHDDNARRGAEEPPEGGLPEPEGNGEADQEKLSDKAPGRRRVPGLHGYDPEQWPDPSI